MNENRRILILLIVLLGFTVYANSINNSFIWDDLVLIINNVFIKSWHFLPEIFTKQIASGADSPSNFYRPLQSFTYLIEYSIFQLNPFIYHFTNLVLHITNSILVFIFIYLVSSNIFVSFLSSVLFLVHPVNVETVTYISGRADSLVTLFILLMLLSYIKFIKVKKSQYYIISMVCFVLALLSKELAFIAPFLLLLYNFSFNEERIKQKIRRCSSFFLIVFVYAFLRLTLLNYSPSLMLNFPYNFVVRFLTFFKSILLYIRLLFVPVDLHMQYEISPSHTIFNPSVLFGSTLFFIIVVLTINSYKKNRYIFFGLAWFLITIIPQSNLFPINAFVAEHFLYIPVIGAIFVFSVIIDRLRRSFLKLKAYIYSGLIIIIVLFSSLTILQNRVWQDPLRFFQYCLRFTPTNYRIINNIAAIYKEMGRYKESEVQYLLAISYAERWNINYVRDMLSQMHTNLAILYRQENRLDLAIRHHLEAVDKLPRQAAIYIEAAETLEKSGEIKQAIEVLRRGIMVSNKKSFIYFALAKIYEKSADNDKAIENYKNCKIQDIRFVPAYSRLGFLYEQIGEVELARDNFLKGLKIDPKYIELYNGIGIFFSKRGIFDKAEEAFNEAIRLEPFYDQAHYNLGAMYYQKKEHDRAKFYLAKAYALNPKITQAKELLDKIKAMKP